MPIASIPVIETRRLIPRGPELEIGDCSDPLFAPKGFPVD